MNKKDLMMIYHVPIPENFSRARTKEILFEVNRQFQNDDFYQVQILPYQPGDGERQDIKIEILDLKNAKKATMSVIDDINDTTEYYYHYEKWLRKQKLKRLIAEEKNINM